MLALRGSLPVMARLHSSKRHPQKVSRDSSLEISGPEMSLLWATSGFINPFVRWCFPSILRAMRKLVTSVSRNLFAINRNLDIHLCLNSGTPDKGARKSQRELDGMSHWPSKMCRCLHRKHIAIFDHFASVDSSDLQDWRNTLFDAKGKESASGPP